MQRYRKHRNTLSLLHILKYDAFASSESFSQRAKNINKKPKNSILIDAKVGPSLILAGETTVFGLEIRL